MRGASTDNRIAATLVTTCAFGAKDLLAIAQLCGCWRGRACAVRCACQLQGGSSLPARLLEA